MTGLPGSKIPAKHKIMSNNLNPTIMFPFDAKVKMQLCHAIVGEMPVYESTGIEITDGALRQHFTKFIVELADGIYMGQDSIGEPFKLSYINLLTASIELCSEKEGSRAIGILQDFYPKMPPVEFAQWIDWLTDQHEDDREIQLCWMTE